MKPFLIGLLILWLQAASMQTGGIQGQTASVQGRIVAAEGANPLTKVSVELRRLGAADPPLVASTAEDGRFAFSNLAPGQYRLTATRSGYAPAEYGQRRPGAAGLPIAVSAGQQVRDIQMPLTLSASVSGRILFQNGRPVVNAEVMAMKASYDGGRRVLTLVQTARTNDLGEYRLYWLTPGRYYISSMPWDGRPISSGVVISANGAAAAVDIARMTVLAGDVARAPLGFRPGAPPSDTEAWLPIFFPGTANEDAASPIELGGGASVRAIDIIVAPVGPRRIRGTVMDALGQPVPNAQIFRSRNAPPSNTFIPEVVDPQRGVFDIRGVAPGPYTLLAIAGDRAGKVVLDVGAIDLDNVPIRVAPGISIPGRLSIEGRPAAAEDPVMASLRVSLRPDPLVPGLPIAASAVAGTGAFTLGQVAPGSYLVTVQPIQPAPPVATGQRGNAAPQPPPAQGLPQGQAQGQRGAAGLPLPAALQGAYLKSVRMGNVDVLNGGLNLEGQPAEPLEIVIGTNPGRLDGDVGRLPNATVALVPAARLRRPDLYKSAVTDVEGRFSFQGVTPGDYLLYAWDDVESGAWMNADFMRDLEGRGRPVRVNEGSVQTIQQLPLLDR